LNRSTPVVLYLVSIALCSAAHAQTPEIPRTPEGRPDFQVVWESRWLTPLERPDELNRPTMTAEQTEIYRVCCIDRLSPPPDRVSGLTRSSGNLSPNGSHP